MLIASYPFLIDKTTDFSEIEEVTDAEALGKVIRPIAGTPVELEKVIELSDKLPF